MTLEKERREMDKVVDMLHYKVDTIAVESQHVREQFEKHVSECATIQKRVFGVVIFVAGWIVAHSPEGLTIMGKALRAVVP